MTTLEGFTAAYGPIRDAVAAELASQGAQIAADAQTSADAAATSETSAAGHAASADSANTSAQGHASDAQAAAAVAGTNAGTSLTAATAAQAAAQQAAATVAGKAASADLAAVTAGKGAALIGLADRGTVDAFAQRLRALLDLPAVNSLALAQGDMTAIAGGQASDDLPHGAISETTGTYYDWAYNPGNQVGLPSPAGWLAATPWFQVYTAVNAGAGRSDTNTRIAVRNLEFWIQQQSTGAWYLASFAPAPAGAGYPENFDTVATPIIGLDSRGVPAGGRSVKMVAGRCFHGYDPNGRVLIPLGDISAVYTCVEIRLEIDDATLPNDFANAHYVASAGADWWETLTNPPVSNSGHGIYCGRFKTVTTDWQIFSGCTMAPSAMVDATYLPPPVQGTRTDAAAQGYQIAQRSMKTSDLANNFTTTATGKALDARAGKTLNDSLTTLSAQVALIGTAGVVQLHDGAPLISEVAGFNGQTVLAYANRGAMPLVLPANATGTVDFTLFQMGAQPIVFLADTGAQIISASNYTQTGGQYAQVRVRLIGNPSGGGAIWMLSGTLAAAASTPSRLWTPYQFGKSAAEVWLDAQDTAALTTASGKVSQILDKSQKGRSVYQATAASQPGLTANAIGAFPGFASTTAAPAQMLWSGAALPVLTDLYYNGGAFLTANAGTTVTWANATFGAAQIVVFSWTPTAAQVNINGADAPLGSASGSFGGYGAVAFVHKPTSAGQSSLGRVLSGSGKAFLNAGSAGARGYDGVVGEVINLTGSAAMDFTALTPRRYLAAYLAWGWGLQALLPAGSPFAAAAPTF